MSKPKEYVKLPGKGRSSFAIVSPTRYSLWLGKDHLLSIMNEGYSEGYKRFYFRDIQAITLRKTSHWAVSNTVFGVILILFALLTTTGYLNKWNAVGMGFIFIFEVFFLICLLVNLIKGPTCKCFLRTAVQSERLYSLNRIRPAHKTINRIKAAVEAVQGPLSAETMGAFSPEVTGAAFHVTAPAPVLNPAQPQRSPVRHYDGKVHLILFP